MDTESPPDLYVEEFIKSLSPQHYKSYIFAKNLLGNTFDIYKSNLFLSWKEKRDSNL